MDRAIDVLSPVVAANGRMPLHARCWPKRTHGSSITSKDPKLAERAGEEAGVALTLNQSYAPAHVVLAMINFGQLRYDGALGEAQKAVVA